MTSKIILSLMATALAGCDRPSPPPVTHSEDADSVVDAAPAADASPPPLQDAQADAQADATMPRLPALSIDGSLVAARMVDPQGARNDPKVWVGFIDVAVDRVVKKVLIVDPDHPETEGAGQAELLATIKTQKWQTLEPLVVHEDPGAPLRHGGEDNPTRATIAEKNGLIVQYREPRLVVTKSGNEILKTDATTFSVPAKEHCPGCGLCPAPLASIDQAFTDHAGSLVMLAIHYGGGSDICWEPPDSYHVVKLSP